MDQLGDVKRYVDEWTRTQLEIWQEKVSRLNIVRTGALHQSFRSNIAHMAEGGSTVRMKFLRYGIYQALGTGRGYRHDNGGDLPFLGSEYRRDNRLDIPRRVGPAWGGYMTSGKPRKKRDWFSKKYYMSLMAMVEDLGRILGEEAAHVVASGLEDSRSLL